MNDVIVSTETPTVPSPTSCFVCKATPAAGDRFAFCLNCAAELDLLTIPEPLFCNLALDLAFEAHMAGDVHKENQWRRLAEAAAGFPAERA